jgi:putative ABC transport system permease protein
MLAFRNMMKNRIRTALNITAVTIAVLAVILLVSLGSGLVSTGEQVFQKSNMHLWITGKPVDLQSLYSNPGEVKLNNAHPMADDIQKDNMIRFSTPMLTEIVYASGDNKQPRAVFGLGVATEGPMVVISEGTNLNPSSHYNMGAYDGPLTQEVLVDSRAAALLNVSVGDTIHVGKTIEDTTDQEFRVVGLTNSLTAFSVNPMLIFPLSEFQYITGNHYYDSATMILIRLEHPDDADAVSQDLKAQYPNYMVNTNTDLLEKIIQENSMIMGSAVSIILLAVFMGGALVINTMLLSINEKRKEIGIMQIIGMSRWSIIKWMGLEGLIICILGGLAGCLLSIPLTVLLNLGIESILGFENVLVLDDIFLIGGFAMALTLGMVSTVAAIWRLSRIQPMEQLRSI